MGKPDEAKSKRQKSSERAAVKKGFNNEPGGGERVAVKPAAREAWRTVPGATAMRGREKELEGAESAGVEKLLEMGDFVRHRWRKRSVDDVYHRRK